MDGATSMMAAAMTVAAEALLAAETVGAVTVLTPAEATTTALQQIVGQNDAAMVEGNCNGTDANGVLVQNANVANKGCNS